MMGQFANMYVSSQKTLMGLKRFLPMTSDADNISTETDNNAPREAFEVTIQFFKYCSYLTICSC